MHLLLAQPAAPTFPSLWLFACMAAGANLDGTWWLVRLHLWLEPPIDVYDRIAEELEGMPEYIARRRWMEAASSYAMGVGPLSRLSSDRMRGWVCQVWIKGYWLRKAIVGVSPDHTYCCSLLPSAQSRY